MMRTLFATLVLFATAAHAQAAYRCPPTYPGKDAPPTPLTGASMRSGELHGNGWIAPPMDEAAEEGYDERYAFADDEQAWLVCTYGSRKRIKGRIHDGHEWAQRMEAGGSEWWIRLAPQVGTCTVQVREVKAGAPHKSTWTVEATCQRQ